MSDALSRLFVALSVVLSSGLLHAQLSPLQVPAAERAVDPGIAAVIAGIKATDDHAHPVLPPPNDKTDRGFDALPVDNMEPETDTMAWRTDNPQLPAAWKALWRFEGTVPLDAQGMKKLEAAREAVRQREGTHFDEWVLDQAGVGVMVANRVAMGPGIAAPRFRWVPYADALLFPLDNKQELAAANPDRALFFPMEDKLRAKYLQEAGLKTCSGDACGSICRW